MEIMYLVLFKKNLDIFGNMPVHFHAKTFLGHLEAAETNYEHKIDT